MAHDIMKQLPEDLLIFILLKFPVKSLIRLECISRNFHTLIQSYTFINLHLNRTTTTKDELILFKRSFQEEPNRYKTILSFLYGDDDNNICPVFSDLDVPYLTSTRSRNYDQLIGPCNGLIALVSNTSAVVFNPATRKYRILPPSPFGSPPGFRRCIEGVGFGFDPIENKYKVVKIAEVYTDPPYKDPDAREKKIEVYDVWLDSWRELDHVDQQWPTLYWLPCSQIYYNDSCHWFAIPYTDIVSILCFDIRTEIFRIMKIPNSCCFFGKKRYGLVVLINCLTLISYPDQKYEIESLQDLMDIWIMREYGACDSWIKKFTIRPFPFESPLASWRNNLLIFQSTTGFLISYDLESEKVRELSLHGSPRSLRVSAYKENMISVPGGNEHSTQAL